MPSWWRSYDRRNGLPWQLRAPNPAVVLTPRYVIGLLAFLICVDMTQVLGVLCYQLFLGTYFPWHLYPLMLNRVIELLALLCSDGHVPSVETGPPSNSILEDQDDIKEYSDVVIAVEQPDGEKYAIARLLKDATVVPHLFSLDEGLADCKDKKNAPLKEKIRCESAQDNLQSCKSQNSLGKSDVSASQVEVLHSDGAVSIPACEFGMVMTLVSGSCLKNEEQSRGRAPLGLQLDQQEQTEVAEPKEDDEELASSGFLTNLTTEIISLCEESICQK